MSKIFKAIEELDATITKEDIVQMGKAHATLIIDSDQFDLVKSYVEVKRYELYLKTLIDELKSKTVKQITASGNKEFEFGTTTAVVSKRRKFDFSNDTYWNQLAQQTKQVTDQKKSHEALLKEMNEGDVKEIVNNETGEVQTIHGPKIQYTETLMVKIA